MKRRIGFLHCNEGFLHLSLLRQLHFFLIINIFKSDNKFIPFHTRLHKLALKILYPIVPENPIIEIVGLFI